VSRAGTGPVRRRSVMSADGLPPGTGVRIS